MILRHRIAPPRKGDAGHSSAVLEGASRGAFAGGARAPLGVVLGWLGACVLRSSPAVAASELLGPAWEATEPFSNAPGESEVLHGRVLLQGTATPVAGVLVRVVGTSAQAYSDEHGAFALAAPSGAFVLAAEGPSIESRVVSSDSVADRRLVVEVAPRGDDEVIVPVYGVGRRARAASSTYVTAREFAAAPRRTAEDALRLVPGLTLVQHGSEGKGHQFFLRGFDAVHGADLELTVEGVPVNEWSNIHGQGYLDLGFVVPEAVLGVRATKGPFTLDQGAFAMAGSADYELGIAEDARGARAMYTIGTTNRHRAVGTFSPRTGDGHDFVALEALHDDGFGQNRAIDRGAVLGRVRLHESDGLGTLSLMGAAYLADFALPGTLREEDVAGGSMGFYDAYDHAGHGTSQRGLLALSHRRQAPTQALSTTLFGGHRRLALLENYTGFLVDPVNGDRRKQGQATWNFGVQSALALQLNAQLGLHLGAGVRGDVFEQRQEHVGQAEEPLTTERQLSGIQTLSHARLGVHYQPRDELLLAIGGRADVAEVLARDALDEGRQGAGTLLALSPRVMAEWRLSSPVHLFAAYGRGFRPPEARAFSSFKVARSGITDDLYTGGEPAMTATDSFELGTRLRPTSALSAQVATFATFVARESVFDHVSGVNLELNNTRRLGAEAVLRARPSPWLTVTGSATYVDARFVDSGNPVPLTPSWVGSVLAVITHESGLRAGLRLFGLTPRPLPHGAKGAALGLLEGTLGYHLGSWDFGLEVENLLDRQIREGEYHYASAWRRAEAPSQLPVVHFAAAAPFSARLSLGRTF